MIQHNVKITLSVKNVEHKSVDCQFKHLKVSSLFGDKRLFSYMHDMLVSDIKTI